MFKHGEYSKENKTIKALEKLSNIFLQQMERKRGSNTTQYPRVNQQKLALTHVIPPDPPPTEHAPTPRTHK